jgi:Na+/H+-dicarboxylate symporter
MNPENIALITQYLDKIGGKLGLTAGHLWPVFVHQQIVEFYVFLLLVFLCAVVFFPLVIYALRNWNRMEDVWQIFFATLMVLTGVFLVAGILVTIGNFSNFLNPEYGAVVDLMRMVRK